MAAAAARSCHSSALCWCCPAGWAAHSIIKVIDTDTYEASGRRSCSSLAIPLPQRLALCAACGWPSARSPLHPLRIASAQRRLCARPLRRPETTLQVVLVSPRNFFIFTPMLPSTAVGSVEFR